MLGHIVAQFTKLPSTSCAICSHVLALKLQSRASQKSTSSSATSPSWGIATAHWLRFAGPAPKKAAIRSSATGPYRQTRWWCKEPCIFFGSTFAILGLSDLSLLYKNLLALWQNRIEFGAGEIPGHLSQQRVQVDHFDSFSCNSCDKPIDH